MDDESIMNIDYVCGGITKCSEVREKAFFHLIINIYTQAFAGVYLGMQSQNTNLLIELITKLKPI